MVGVKKRRVPMPLHLQVLQRDISFPFSHSSSPAAWVLDRDAPLAARPLLRHSRSGCNLRRCLLLPQVYLHLLRPLQAPQGAFRQSLRPPLNPRRRQFLRRLNSDVCCNLTVEVAVGKICLNS